MVCIPLIPLQEHNSQDCTTLAWFVPHYWKRYRREPIAVPVILKDSSDPSCTVHFLAVRTIPRHSNIPPSRSEERACLPLSLVSSLSLYCERFLPGSKRQDRTRSVPSTEDGLDHLWQYPPRRRMMEDILSPPPTVLSSRRHTLPYMARALSFRRRDISLPHRTAYRCSDLLRMNMIQNCRALDRCWPLRDIHVLVDI